MRNSLRLSWPANDVALSRQKGICKMDDKSVPIMDAPVLPVVCKASNVAIASSSATIRNMRQAFGIEIRDT